MTEHATWSEVSIWLATIGVQASLGEPQWLAMDEATRLLFIADATLASQE